MEICEQEVTDAVTAPGAPEPMMVDSGVDVRLGESLSQLSLKQVTLNRLATDDRVQTEPTFELTPVTTEKLEQRDTEVFRINEHPPQIQKPMVIDWQRCYTQDDDDGDTLLHLAILQGFWKAAFIIIRMAPHCCLLDILNDDGQSPLYLAVLTRQPRIVRRLILAGANPALRNRGGNTALHLACKTGDLASAMALTDSLTPLERNYLLPGGKVPALPQYLEQRNYDGDMCLHVAVNSGHVELVRLLVRLGADLEGREGLSGYTALHLAVEGGCRSVVTFLLKECRPCLDARSYGGITPYQIAVYKDLQIASELVRAGATPKPLPESESDSDSDISDDDDAIDAVNVVGVKV
ncbi:NF-kappa-B inhibitor cactus-like isoform X2 [Lasioglossum baleicum]